MKLFKYILIFLVIALVSVYFLLQNHSIQNRLFENTVRGLFQADEIFMSDALSVAVCGSRAPLPSPNRAETCLLVQAGASKFIIFHFALNAMQPHVQLQMNDQTIVDPSTQR